MEKAWRKQGRGKERQNLPRDHITSNREFWNQEAKNYVAAGQKAWANDQPLWGIYGIPESEIGLLKYFHGGDVVELGCGTAYISAWLTRRNGRPVGIDNSPAQLKTAAIFQEQFEVRFPLIHGDAEQLPFRDESFDFAISEYGAAIWCDPYQWIPEAARVLRPGGHLAFLGNSALLMLCVSDDDETPAKESLLRPQLGMHRFEWPDDPGIEFHISHGELIDLLRSCQLEIIELIELYPPADTEETEYAFVNLEWAQKWPSEEAWIVRKSESA